MVFLYENLSAPIVVALKQNDLRIYASEIMEDLSE